MRRCWRRCKIAEPRDHRQRALLNTPARPDPDRPSGAVSALAHHFENVEHEIETLGFLGVYRERDVGLARLRRQINGQRRQKLFHDATALDPFVSGMQCRELHRDAGPLEDRCELSGNSAAMVASACW
jgi:hypothetical protein